MTAVHIEITRKCYPGVDLPLLRSLQLRVNASEFVSIVGPSGAGKTTLLNMIAGLDQDYEGDIHLPDDRERTSLACMFQEPRLMPWLTVRQNLQLVMPETDNQRINKVLERVGLVERAEAYPAELSGGMQRRVALARAFVIRPRLLLLDEPFLSLDRPTANQIRNLLLQLVDDIGSTVVLVTHDLHEAVALSDRILFFSRNPTRLIHQEQIPHQKTGLLDDPEVQSMSQDLLHRHPKILEGVVMAGSSENERKEVVA